MQRKNLLPTFLKWAGGKRQILPLIEKFFPQKIERYFEPFLGGGSVFFYVKQKYNPKSSVISDTNKDLIDTYIAVRDNPKKLVQHLKWFKKQHSKDFFYKVRSRFNQKKYTGIRRSAAFIYLNKTCFNGLYRVNRKNEFNVPIGSFKKVNIFDPEVIYRASRLLKDNVEIRHQDYQEIKKYIRPSDFVYLDPCYDPIKKTSFANYTPNRFSVQDRINLFHFIESLRKKGAKVVLSNNDVPEIRKIYSGYDISEIFAPRYIGSRVKYRTGVIELVIRT